VLTRDDMPNSQESRRDGAVLAFAAAAAVVLFVAASSVAAARQSAVAPARAPATDASPRRVLLGDCGGTGKTTMRIACLPAIVTSVTARRSPTSGGFRAEFPGGAWIYCTKPSEALSCGHSGPVPTGAVCLFGGPLATVDLGRKGAPMRLFVCADEGTYGAGLPALTPGDRWRGGGYRCRRTRERLTCRFRASRHGFTYTADGRSRPTSAARAKPRRCGGVEFPPGYGAAARIRAYRVSCAAARRIASTEGARETTQGWRCEHLNPSPGRYRAVCFQQSRPARHVRYVELD
jgi:hypothetical protein